MNQNEFFTEVKPQSLLIRRVQGLIVCLAATSHIFCDMVQTPTLCAGPSNWISKKHVFNSLWEPWHCFYENTWRGERYECKGNKYGKDYQGILLSMCAWVSADVQCVYAWRGVLGVSIMVGAWPQWFVQRCRFLPYRIQFKLFEDICLDGGQCMI